MKVLKKLQQNAAPTVGDDLVNKTYADGLVSGAGVVHLAGSETITGSKTITANDTIFDGGGAGAGAALRMRNALTNTDVFSTRSTGDTADTRLAIHSGGNILWGDGVNPATIRLTHSSNATLELIPEGAQPRVAFQIADAPVAGADLANKTYVDSVVGSAPANMVTTDTTQTITGAKTFSADTIIGSSAANQLKLGSISSSAALAHEDRFTSSDFALMQTSGGQTFINGVGSILFRISNGNNLAVMSATGINIPTGFKISQVDAPTVGNDLVNKTYADSLSSGGVTTYKLAVRLASVVNVNVASPGNLDSTAGTVGDRVLLAGQTNPVENGIYLWNGAATPLTRTTDADAALELNTGATVWVAEGSSHARTWWTLVTTGNNIVPGTSAQSWFKGPQWTSQQQWNFFGNVTAVDGSSFYTSGLVLSTGGVNITGTMSAATTKIVRTKVTGDVNDRFAFTADGALQWGPGSTLADTTLSRTGVGIIALGATHKIQQNAAPTTGDDLTNKTYVDSRLSSGSLQLTPVRAMTDPTNGTNINIAAAPVSVDGITLANGDRIVLGKQTTASQNGIWVYNGSGNALTRPTDFAAAASIAPGTSVYVREGSTWGGSWMVLTGTANITVDTTAQVWNSDGSWGFFRKNGAISVRTDGQLNFNGQLSIIGNQVAITGNTPLFDFSALSAATNIYLQSKLAADTTYKYQVQADGKQLWGAGGVAAVDTNLYRSSGDLKTDNVMRSAQDFIARTGTTAQSIIGAYGPANEAGLCLGSAFDTILYRSAAGIFFVKATHKIQQSTAPTVGNDLTNKTYVDAAAGTGATDAAFTVNAQVGTVVPVRINLKNAAGAALAVQSPVDVWLSDLATGRQSAGFVLPNGTPAFLDAADLDANVTKGWPTPSPRTTSWKQLMNDAADGNLDVGVKGSVAWDGYVNVGVNGIIKTSPLIHLGAAAGAYSAAVLADNPIAYYRLDEVSGTTMIDQIAPGTQNGSYVGAPLLNQPGAVSGNAAVNFSTTGKNALIPAVAALHPSGTIFSFECWFKRNGGMGNGYMMDMGLNDFCLLEGTAGQINFSKDTGAGASSGLCYTTTAPSDTTTWHHIVVTKAGALATDNRMFIDGVEVTYAGQFVQTITPNTGATISIAKTQAAASNYYNGSLDEIAFYNTVLSPARIAAHYAAR